MDLLRRETTPNGNLIDFRRFDNGLCFLQWGSPRNMRTLPDTFYYEQASHLNFVTENENYLVVEYVFGTGNNGAFILPLHPDANPVEVYTHYDFDLNNDLVASTDFIEDKDGIEHYGVIVRNLRNNKIQKIPLNGKCPDLFRFCINDLFIYNKTVYYTWVRDRREENKNVKDSVKIEI